MFDLAELAGEGPRRLSSRKSGRTRLYMTRSCVQLLEVQ
jgi:hypothetical protein